MIKLQARKKAIAQRIREERFKKLDETIRSHQVLQREKVRDKKGLLSKLKSLGT